MNSTPTDIALPAAALSHLRRALRSDVNALGATHVLHDVGFSTGLELGPGLERELGAPAGDVPAATFWRKLSGFFERRGWGRFEVERVHPGLGMLRAHGWAESDPAGADAQPGCHLSCGLLSCVLGQSAQAPIAVLEVRCRSRGDEHCAFLYGSEHAIHEVYGLLLEGAPLERALEEL